MGGFAATSLDRSPARPGHKQPVAPRSELSPRQASKRQVPGADPGSAVGTGRPVAATPPGDPNSRRRRGRSAATSLGRSPARFGHKRPVTPRSKFLARRTFEGQVSSAEVELLVGPTGHEGPNIAVRYAGPKLQD